MLRRLAFNLGLLGIAALVLGGTAQAQALGTTDEIVSCVAGNIPKGDELRSITLVTTGAERVTRADVFGRRTPEGLRRTLVTFSAPEELEGSGMLISEVEGGTEMWIHTPDLGRRRIITGAERGRSLFRTGLSYEDFVHLLGFVRTGAAKLARLGDDRIGERAVYVLESTPEPGSSAYERVVTSVDKKTCIPLQAKFYENARSAPRKVLTTDPEQIFPVSSIWVAHSATLRDHRDQKETVLHIESVMPDIELPDEPFDPEFLGKLRPHIELDVTFDPIEPEIQLEPLN